MEFNGWEKLSLVDFDGNLTTTIFSSGCPFRCPFCHNADLVLHPNALPVIPFEEILAYLKKRRGILEGVCISGGEPTIGGNDLLVKMSLIKELGYKIKLDSNGCNPSLLKEAVSKGLVDFIAMDIKNTKAKYPQTIGLKNFDLALIEESVAFLLSNQIPYEFRTTLIDEFHTEEDILEIKQWIKGANRYFLQCYIDSENCIEHGFHPVSFEKAKHFVALLENSFGKVALRGYEDPNEAK